MDNRVAGCQPPAGVTPLLRFGLPSPPGVVGMVMAPGSASWKHPFYVVCKCGLGCCVCSGRRVGVGAWGRGPLVMLHVRALFVGGGGCAWVKCPCGGFGPHPGCWVLGWCWCSSLLWRHTTLLCSAMLCAACCRVLAPFSVCLCRLWSAVLPPPPRAGPSNSVGPGGGPPPPMVVSRCSTSLALGFGLFSSVRREP